MNRFGLVRPPTVAEAQTQVEADPDARLYRAGGIDLLDRMKEGLDAPSHLVELGAIDGDFGARLRAFDVHDDGATIGALTTLAAVADAKLPGAAGALQQAAHSAATPGIRNAATLGGNLLQRPRCWYYRHADLKCLKKGGSACLALTGDHRYHAIFGGGPSYIVHPSTLATALTALDATVTIVSPGGTERTIALSDLFALPTVDVQREHTLAPGEILAAVQIPAAVPETKSVYVAAREKQSHDWPLCEVAVRVTLEGGAMRDVRVALGHVAPIPWRSKDAEAALERQAPTAAAFAAAAKAATKAAGPLQGNRYKVPLCQGLVRQALHLATSVPLPE